MARNNITDKYGCLLGWTQADSSGRIYIYDKYGRAYGFYNPKVDTTCEMTGRLVGHGNLLSTLLPVQK